MGALAALEAKYCKQPGGKAKRKAKGDEPSEEEFAAAAQRLNTRKDSQGEKPKLKRGTK